jgi:hypothetical protein
MKMIAAMLAVALSTFAYAGGNATNQTGQGIMVNLKTSGTFAIDTTNIYRFDQQAAASFFSNTWNGVAPAVACNGSACNGDVCGVPAAPDAPAANPFYVTNPGGSAVGDKSRCTFLDGGVLTLTDTYQQQTAPVPVSCSVPTGKFNKDGTPVLAAKSGSYTFTYTYVVAPVSSEPVPALTAWPLDQVNSSGLAHVALDADIAGESVLSKTGTKKFSFSMLDAGVNRVQNLAITLDGVLVAANQPSDVYYPVDFVFTKNAGSNGATALLVDGDARSILNNTGGISGDNFAGNDNGGADGSALSLARMQTVGLDVGPGTFTVGLTGSVKDNGAATSVGFDVAETLTIVTPGCGRGN